MEAEHKRQIQFMSDLENDIATLIDDYQTAAFEADSSNEAAYDYFMQCASVLGKALWVCMETAIEFQSQFAGNELPIQRKPSRPSEAVLLDELSGAIVKFGEVVLKAEFEKR